MFTGAFYAFVGSRLEGGLGDPSGGKARPWVSLTSDRLIPLLDSFQAGPNWFSSPHHGVSVGSGSFCLDPLLRLAPNSLGLVTSRPRSPRPARRRLIGRANPRRLRRADDPRPRPCLIWHELGLHVLDFLDFLDSGRGLGYMELSLPEGSVSRVGVLADKVPGRTNPRREQPRLLWTPAPTVFNVGSARPLTRR